MPDGLVRNRRRGTGNLMRCWLTVNYLSSFISSSHRLAVVKVRMTVTALVAAMAAAKGLDGGKVTPKACRQLFVTPPVSGRCRGARRRAGRGRRAA